MNIPVAQFTDFIRNAVKSRFVVHSRIDDSKLHLESYKANDVVLGHWMSLILVSGKAAKITFKIHFAEKSAKFFAAHAIMAEQAKITTGQAHDFIKEFCNLSAGFLKRQFEEKGENFGISLPLVTRGFDEIFFPRKDDKTRFSDIWTIGDGQASLTCSYFLEVFSPEQFSAIPFEILQPGAAADDGEVEFL